MAMNDSLIRREDKKYDEVEVEAIQVLKKKMKLRAVQGQLFPAEVGSCYERLI